MIKEDTVIYRDLRISAPHLSQCRLLARPSFFYGRANQRLQVEGGLYSSK